MPNPSFRGTVALGSMALGTSVAVYNMFDWTTYQYYFSRSQGGPRPSSSRSTRAQSISIFLLLLGFYLAYESLKRRPSSDAPPLCWR